MSELVAAISTKLDCNFSDDDCSGGGSSGSCTDLDVSVELAEALQPAARLSRERSRRLCTERGMTRSQTVYTVLCSGEPLSEASTTSAATSASAVAMQNRVLEGLTKPELSLAGRYLGPATFRPVGRALRVNEHVTKLDFSHNGLEAEGMLHLSKVLRLNTTVRELNLSGNNIGDKGAIAVADLMRYNSTIQMLDVSDNRIGDSGGKFLALGIEQSDSVRQLRLDRNCLSEAGGLHVGRALAENFVLEELDISWCRVRRIGAVALCQGVGKSIGLARVNLSWNGLGYEGSLALSRLLQTNKYLRELDAAHCRIDWQGARLIADGLRVNYSLMTLRIGGNPLTTTGCIDILEALTADTSVVSLLDLKGNKVTSDFELLSQTISAGREFRCQHDGVLPSHDLFGRRNEPEAKDPMAEVIDYMQRYHLRPLELFRSFDKDLMMQMNRADFIDRLKRAGINLSKDEMAEIVQQINSGGPGGQQQKPQQTGSGTAQDKIKTADINFRNFSDGIRLHKRREREKKAREANAQRRLTVYHQDILGEGTAAAAAAATVSWELRRLSLEDAFNDSGPPVGLQQAQPARLEPLSSGRQQTEVRRKPAKRRKHKKAQMKS